MYEWHKMDEIDLKFSFNEIEQCFTLCIQWSNKHKERKKSENLNSHQYNHLENQKEMNRISNRMIRV